MRIRYLLCLISAACQGFEPAEIAVRIDGADGRAFSGDLRCVLTANRDEVTLSWTVDGQPAPRALRTTDYPDDTFDAEFVRPGRTIACKATYALEGEVFAEAEDAVEVGRPHILLLIADALGPGDPDTFGGRVPTPNLSRLQAEGTHLTEAYAASAASSPARAGLLTGTMPNRFGFEYDIGPQDAEGAAQRGVPPGVPFLADVLSDAGYHTAHIGQWHLGTAADFAPMRRGYQRFFGHLGNDLLPLPPGEGRTQVYPHSSFPDAPDGDTLQEGGTPVPRDGHLLDQLADAAIAEIHDAAGGGAPLFLSLAFSEPGGPLATTPEHEALLPRPPSNAHARAAEASLAATDHHIGRILDALDDSGIADDTIVVFLSDAGCPADASFCYNGPRRGGRNVLHEGGLRVPVLMRWPDRIPAGHSEAAIFSALDLMPTLARAAGAGLPTDAALDGFDQLAYLRGITAEPPREGADWRLLPAAAARVGPYKIVAVVDLERLAQGGDDAFIESLQYWLFNLEDDPAELTDLKSDPDLEEVAQAAVALLAARSYNTYVRPAWIGTEFTGAYYGINFELGH